MKITVNKPVDLHATAIRVTVPVEYEEEDIPNDFPLRVKDVWTATIDLHSGLIHEWPAGKTGDIYMKVCDSGVYELLDAEGTVLATREDYVPHCIPMEDGDYIAFKIDADGRVANWSKFCTAENVKESFFGNDDE